MNLGCGGTDGACIAQARRLAAGFLARARSGQGGPVSQRAVDLTRLVVSELVTNARKYAPGPVLMELRITGEAVEVVVWNSDPVLPVARASDAGRVGQHGLEIVMAVAQGVEARREPVGKRSSERRRKSIGPMPIRAVQFTVPTRGGAAR
ncbi:ATP-binding protein [Streptomyces olivaceoviridis]|uniref:ATP-binding protein n=1 Tax=Streptomyces olivaceoviridis TaxID=1921 RepID=A0ABW7V1N2_STROI|nr:ATP-binding protein [Streptomyces corchorusii]